VEEELLSGSEQVKCSSCGKTCNARKRLQVFSYPQLLVLTLKRFNSSSGFGGAGSRCLGKNDTPVVLDAQAVLDLTPYCNPLGLQAAAARGIGPPLYQLLAVSEHSGCLGGGHYTAQGRSVMDGCWYRFDDNWVSPESCPAGNSSSAAYVLFFRLLSAV
jgi:ubiquitin C-terminal hydrolase